MQYIIGIDNIGKDRWDSFMAAMPSGNFRQTTSWGAIRAGAGWQPEYVCVENDGKITAAILIFIRKIPYIGLSLFYGCRGPVVDWNDFESLETLTKGIRAAAKKNRAILIRTDPEPAAETDLIRKSMKKAGYLLFEREFTAWNRTQYELRVKLEKSEEETFQGIRRTLRQDINSSKRKGVSIDCTVADGDELRFCEIMSGLENVKNSIIHSNAYYQMVYRETIASGGLLVKARYQDKTIAIMTVAFVGERCWAVYMANDYEYRNLAPNKVLMWEGIRIALSRSCRFFDMGATQGKSFDPEDPLDRYKLGFVPEIVQFPGYFDYPFSPVLYQVFKFLEFKLVPLAHYLKRRIGILVKKKVNIITKTDTDEKASSI